MSKGVSLETSQILKFNKGKERFILRMEGWFNIQKIKETFKKDLEEVKNKQTMMNNTINEIKNSLEGINSRIIEAKEWISDLEDKIV